MAIPDYQTIMLPLLHLAGDTKAHRVHDAVDHLAREFNLTEEERQELIPSGRVPRFHNNVTWARTYMKKAGLLEDPKRGEFRITERGRRVLADGHSRIDAKLLTQFEEFRHSSPLASSATGWRDGSTRGAFPHGDSGRSAADRLPDAEEEPRG